MDSISEYKNRIPAPCKNCGEVNFIEEKYCWKKSNGYKVNKVINCSRCGEIIREIINEPIKQTNNNKNDEPIKCPKCGSTQITAGNKGFGLGKAAVGGVLIGPVGLLGGLVGSKKVMVTCLKCGKKWEAGKL